MSPRTPVLTGLVALVLLAPVAGAMIGAVNVPTVTPPSPQIPNGHLNVQEGPLTIVGPAHSPTKVRVVHEGKTLLDYAVDADGRARLDVAGENALADATFVRLEGDPLGNAFALVLRDATGGTHVVSIDRVLLLAGAERPDLEPAIKIERPLSWPGAPERSYLLHVKDGHQNQLAAADLNGAAFLQKAGKHRAVLQVPHAENEWDRWFLQARRADGAMLNATFAEKHSTGDALILAAEFFPSHLSPAEGERIDLTVIHERRLSPLLVERFAEPVTYGFRVDGGIPTVTLNAPSSSIDFRFTVTWSGKDALSGVGLFVLHYRESGASQWIHWTSTEASAAVFSGDWGKSYDIRARSLDRVGNPSNEAIATTTIIAKPSGQDDVNDPPTARLLSPAAGSELRGVVPIAWQAADPDGTSVTSRIEVSDDDGDTWRVLYTGTGLSATWDTTHEADGAGYRIRLTVSDGTLAATDVASALKVRNVVAPPAPAAPGSTQPPSSSAPPAQPTSQPAAPPSDAAPVEPASAEDEGGKDVPAPFVGAALIAAALLARRRRA